MPRVILDFTDADFELVKKHARARGMKPTRHIHTLAVESGYAIALGDKFGGFPRWFRSSLTQTQHARNTHVDPEDDK